MCNTFKEVLSTGRGLLHSHIQFNFGVGRFFWFFQANVICNTSLFTEVELVFILDQVLNVIYLLGGVEIDQKG